MRRLVKPDGSPVRVLQIGKFYPPYKGGMETHLQDLCRNLASHLDLQVLVANDCRQTVHEFDGNIPVHRVATMAKVSSAPVCPGMIRAIRSSRADIVHIHVPNPAAVLALLASGYRAPIVVTYQSDIVRQKFLTIAYDPFDRRFLDRAKAIVCLSPNYIESSNILAAYRDKCTAIPHGIDPAPFSQVDMESVSRLRSQYGENIVLGVGRLVYYKGFEHLVRAISGTPATLLLIGNGPLHGRLQDVARETGVSERVHFLGEVSDVLPYYHAAKVFVLPSIARSEAFGIVQLEAMACGTPVVNTRLESGVPFVSLDGESGLTIPPANVDALRNAINLLLSNETLRQQFGKGARDRVKSHFTVQQMTERTLTLYSDVLSGNPIRRNFETAATVTA